jgi:hypothetical protein
MIPGAAKVEIGRKSFSLSPRVRTIHHVRSDRSMWVEAWSPEYGASYELAAPVPSSAEEVAPYVETATWAPLRPPDLPLPPVAFVDGVSRVDARAFLDAGDSTVPGLCGSVGIGSVTTNGRSAFGPCAVRRAVVFGGGNTASLPPMPGALHYESRSVPGTRPEEVRHGLESCRAEVEAELARDLARAGWLVVADGALGVLEPLPVIGFIKSHQRAYLAPDLEPVVRALGAGERTPVFAFGVVRPRYSWYIRLAVGAGQHPWAGIARCEVTAAVSLERAVELAGLTALHLPRFASKPFWDPRAPQNLVPVAGLERRLWHLLGDRALVYRRIRSALAAERRVAAPVGAGAEEAGLG